MNSAVSDFDRLGFTLFLALAIHGVLLLGISFHADPKPSAPSPAIEVTLATQAAAKPPPKADFIAPVHQQGSGEAEQAQRLTSPRPATTQTARQQLSQTKQTPARPRPKPKTASPAVTRQSQSVQPVPQRAEPAPTEATTPARDSTLLERSIEIASLEAELERQQQVRARRPRVRTISAVSTQATVDAYYLDAWRQKIEAVGNLNYPQQAREQQIYGSLRMMVRLLPDGSVDRIQIIESSGHPLLDEAAVRIVRLAEPFAPFPPELSREVDVLQIIRTWRFRNSYSSSP